METMSGLDGLGWPNPEDEPKPKTMNDTPETDAEANNGSLCDQCVPVDFARKLERERDEAREETIRTREFMGRGFAKAKEELATMETRHAATMMHTQSVVEDAKQLREQRDAVTLRLGNTQERMIDAERQRDRLAEALNKIQLVMVDGFDKLKRIDEIATEALQSLTPKEL
jgi:hypothetical protein